MLGLPGFVVLAVSDYAGEVEQAIETTVDVVGCPECGAVAQLHDRRPCWVRDLPAGGRPVALVWVKRVWRTWTETSAVIAPRASLTERARAEICRRVGQDGASVAAVARDFGIGWRTAMAAVSEHGTPRVDDPSRLDGVEVVGLDETAFQAASATRSTSFVTGIVDLTRHRGGSARLLDVVDDRSASTLVSWINQRNRGWRAGIGVAALDPYRGYASALRASLPHAVRVVDAFHIVRLGFAAVDEVRRRIQREQTGHRGRTGDPLYGIRRLLRRAVDHHSERSWARLLTPGTPPTSSSPAPGSPPRTCG
jgi:transposase